MWGWQNRVIAVCVAGLCLGLGACATTSMRMGVYDVESLQLADLTTRPGVRFWGDEVPSDIVAEVRQRLPNMPRLAQAATYRGTRPKVEVLALSGGGGDGAFGAGVLSGWSARGDRPSFEVVTGVSAGAIIAPFAFLGPRHDHELREIWTHYRTSQIVTAQILPGLLGGSALADTSPMQALIAKYVDRALLRAVAREYAKGRILLIGTTNLDAQRPVVWNMGEIARSGHPQALDLFRKVILASAAIPGAFPPVEIPVKLDGRAASELHVDGGTTREIFVSPVRAPFREFDRLYPVAPHRELYLITNMKVDPVQDEVAMQAIPIAARAISTLIKSQSRGEVYRIYRLAQDDGVAFNYLSVPADFDMKANEFFDPEYQLALFEEGYRLGKAGDAWQKSPPQMRSSAIPGG